jgi:hypothetical protein
MTFEFDTCDYCERAATNPNWGHYRSQCKGCAIRALAQSPSYHESSVKGAMTPTYRAALGVIFGDGWQAGHALVRGEFSRLKGL